MSRIILNLVRLEEEELYKSTFMSQVPKPALSYVTLCLDIKSKEKKYFHFLVQGSHSHNMSRLQSHSYVTTGLVDQYLNKHNNVKLYYYN